MNNRLTKQLSFAAVFLCMLIFAMADVGIVKAATFNSFTYKTINSGKNIEITRYTGKSTSVAVPDVIRNKRVISIGANAFANNSKVKSVLIPNSIKTVKMYAFFNCKSLKNVELSNKLTRIGSYAFGYTKGHVNLKGFTITGSMGTAAFRYAELNDMTFTVKDITMGNVYTERLKDTLTNVSWDKVNNADGYFIYRSEKSSGSFKKIDTVKGDEKYADDKCESGKTYYYRVKAFKNVEENTYCGKLSGNRTSIWGKYNKAKFDLKLRNKGDESAKQGVYYELFVRSFADSNGDGIGDLNGVTSKLDYLKELGIEGIWLMPVNSSPSYHGYDTTDYYGINSDYGTEQDFQNLLTEAHKRGIKVIMDFVINHTSNEHPWFKDACSSVNSKYRDYYRFVSKYDTANYNAADQSPWGSDVWQSCGNYYFYSAFYGLMPDLNYNNKAVRKEIKAAAGKWLNMGVDGFRLDAAMHIYGDNEFKQQDNQTASNIQWWNEFASYCETINPKVYLVGEAWQNDEVLAEYVQPFDTKFNFSFEENMIKAVQNEKAVLDDGKYLQDTLKTVLDEYGKVDTKYIDGVFGTNHDQNRIMSAVNDNPDKARLIANIYMTLSGNPFIYYGEELGMKGSGDDEDKRTPFKWTADGTGMDTKWEADTQNTELKSLKEQTGDEASIYNYYKKLIALRKSDKALNSGSYSPVSTDNTSVLSYARTTEDEKVIVLHNLSSKEVKLNVEAVKNGKVIYSTGSSSLDEENVTIGAYCSILIRV